VTARKSVRLGAVHNFYGAVRPASLLRKSILDLKPAGLCDGWLHCNIQVVCHAAAEKLSCNIKRLIQSFGTLREDATTHFEQKA
jgi:hypothetical protein